MDPQAPSLPLLWGAFTGYQLTAAIRTGVELDVFTRIAAGADTIEALARECGAAPRGLRALLNHLVIDGFLARDGDRYRLTPTSATFLDRRLPTFIGSAVEFLASPGVMDGFARLTEAVRKGGTATSPEGTLAPEHPIWVDFAKAMAPIAALSATLVASAVDAANAGPGKLLDIAAGHGMFGITFAQQNPGLEVTAVDWANVLEVARENARLTGVADRFHPLPGSAFEVPFGSDYRFVLLPNFLHHFDPPTCEQIMRKCGAALAANGELVIVEFIPDEDRLGPPEAVTFALVMLSSTPAGDAYTFNELEAMARNAGFTRTERYELPPAPMRVLTAR